MGRKIYNRDTDPRLVGTRDSGEARSSRHRGPALPPIYVLTKPDVFWMCFWAAFVNTIAWIIIGLLFGLVVGYRIDRIFDKVLSTPELAERSCCVRTEPHGGEDGRLKHWLYRE